MAATCPTGRLLLELLQPIDAQAPDDLRFRISSLEPMDCSDDLVDLVRLRRASRRIFTCRFSTPAIDARDDAPAYTLDYYGRLVDRIRERMPHASIGSDVIVGFPGETDDDFADARVVSQRVAPDAFHVFPYSDRPGTARRPCPTRCTAPSCASARAPCARSAARWSGGFHAARTEPVRPGLTIEDGSLVVTDNYLKVRIPPGHVRNEWVSVTSSAAIAEESVDSQRELVIPCSDPFTHPVPTADARRLLRRRFLRALPRSTDRMPRECRGRGSFAPTRSPARRRGSAQTCRPARPTGART